VGGGNGRFGGGVGGQWGPDGVGVVGGANAPRTAPSAALLTSGAETHETPPLGVVRKDRSYALKPVIPETPGEPVLNGHRPRLLLLNLLRNAPGALRADLAGQVDTIDPTAPTTSTEPS
jgi:hypothetical protein